MRLTLRSIALVGSAVWAAAVASESRVEAQILRSRIQGGYPRAWSGYAPASPWAGYAPAAVATTPAPPPVVVRSATPGGWSGYAPATAWQGYNPGAAWRGYVPVQGYTYRAPTSTTRTTTRGVSSYRSDPAGRPIAQAKPWLRDNPWSYSR